MPPDQVTCTVQTDDITAAVSKTYDLKFDGSSTFQIPDMPPPPTHYGIGAIIGPSGSGKTILLNTIARSERPLWIPNKPICSHFKDFTQARDQLSAVGLNSIPTWFKPYHVLSTGEAARANLARTLHSGAAIDEFTSTIDRTTAQTLAASLHNYVTKAHAHNITVATCHRDILPWLDPDWTFFTANRVLHSRGSVRPAELTLRVHRCTWNYWPHFRPHHYLTHQIHKHAACYLGTWDRQPVVFTAVLPHPSPHPKKAFREHRTVVLPQFQGIGIGTAFSNAIAHLYTRKGHRYYSRTSHPRMGEHRQRSPHWIPTGTNLRKQPAELQKTQISDHWQPDTVRICYSHRYQI